MNNSCSDWLEVVCGVPQGSIFGPLLSNIFLADLFFTLGDVDIGNFAERNISYVSGKNLDKVIESSEQTSGFCFNGSKISSEK